MNTHRRSIVAATAVLVITFAGAPTAQARPTPDDGPFAGTPAHTASPSLNDTLCKIERVGNRLVRCDHPTGATAAPRWVPQQGARP
ncbi:hypothetical protein [Mumia sp. Pv 4-285]|uniref:hypothetical protein n=1 Tax=Mumia qirimensis TaxID=3234852 RepID=UPI00351D4C5D